MRVQGGKNRYAPGSARFGGARVDHARGVAVNQPSDGVLRDIPRRMARIRVFETEAGRMAEAGKNAGTSYIHVHVREAAAGAA